jgi:general secretion pathway protein N
MQRRTRLIAAGAAVFLAGLVILFPARAAYHWFGPDTVRLSGISGTVWRGSAAEASLGGLYVGTLRWSFRPLALLTGKAGYAIVVEPLAGSVAGDVAVSPGGSLHVSDLSGRLPISAASGIAGLDGIDGIVELQVESLVARDGRPVRAVGTVDVANLVAAGLSPSPLGDYRAEFATADEVITGQVQDVSGVLDLTGTLEVRPDGSYSFAGRVAATGRAPSRLVQQLQELGSPDADGMRSFRVEGRL